jgi:hypothetical protein
MSCFGFNERALPALGMCDQLDAASRFRFMPRYGFGGMVRMGSNTDRGRTVSTGSVAVFLPTAMKVPTLNCSF